MLRICDAHVHLGESGPWQPYSDPSINVTDLVRLFDQYGVHRAVVFPNPNVGDKYPRMNDYIAESVKKYPNRLVGFGRVDPRRDDAVRELTRMRAKLQLTGLKLHPIVECFRPDHPFFDKLFKKAADLRLPVLLHTGDGLSSPGLISAVVKKYPKLLVILGHLKEGALGPMKQFENVYVETSGSIPEVIELASHIDEERVLFGSDAPYYRYPTQIAAVEVADVSQKTKNKIFYGNFEELFPLN